jgi:hypothetical protein
MEIMSNVSALMMEAETDSIGYELHTHTQEYFVTV